MRQISAEDIREHFTMRDAIEADREAFRLQAEGAVELPVRTNFEVKPGEIASFMPALVKSYPLAGIKIVSTYPNNPSRGLPVTIASLFVLDPETGVVNAVLDGTEVTRMRTAAVSGLATELLSREDSSTAALFGTGGQAKAQLEALLTVRPIKEVRIFDKQKDRIKTFIGSAQSIADRFGARLVEAASPEAAADGADVITTVTTTTEPVFDGKYAKDGAHINAVGAFIPTKRELDSDLVCRASRIFIDNRDACMAEAGDILIPISEGRLKESDIAGELGDLIVGRAHGRRSAGDITIMKTVGFGTLDIVAAAHIMRKIA